MESAFGYGGTHSSIYDAIYFLNHLESVDTNTIDVEGAVCAICQGSLSDPKADQTWHQFVRLPSCGHLFGRSCLFSWLTPFDQEQVKNDDDDNNDNNDDDDDDDDNDNDDEDEDEDDQMSEVENAENETVLVTEPSSESRGSRWMTVNVQPTTSTDDGYDKDYGNSDDIEEGTGDDSDEDNEDKSSSDPTADEAMEEASAETDNEQSDDQDDREEDSEDESSSDSADEVIGEASAETDIDQSGTQVAPRSFRSSFQSRRSKWLPDKAAHIDKTVSWTHFLLQFPISELPGRGQERIDPQSYSLAYRSGDTDTGLETLRPGNNICPCCRDEVFTRPARVDSLMYLATRIRVWDTAYAFLGIKSNFKEKCVRDQCLKFIETYLFHRISLGEGVNGGNGTKVIQALKDARWSLVQTNMNTSDRSICKSEEVRGKLHAFGKAMRYRSKDLKVWYSNDTFKVWYGPEDPPVRYAIQVGHLQKWSGNLD
ncbi:MAG: hypothetical protein L6R38_003747 [Xanthoria sp. 2 TBL-2021]|nr:MAG: hypothetical protein L6R38_003747 [Xanthoria sp. 2 TBL-2021]